jgi:hypothetical protein
VRDELGKIADALESCLKVVDPKLLQKILNEDDGKEQLKNALGLTTVAGTPRRFSGDDQTGLLIVPELPDSPSHHKSENLLSGDPSEENISSQI